jgi:formylglycine-generating enzyme required for sulfatase activity
VTRSTLLWIVAAVAAIACLAVVLGAPNPTEPCGWGFVQHGARCCAQRSDACVSAAACPPPLVVTNGRCAAPDARVEVPETTVLVGPADWEAEGRVAPRTVHTKRFAIDAFELSDDDVRAVAGISRDRARALCKKKGGRLPTDDEWTVAAAGSQPRRYPWGDTGAVCRRGAWGLESGPCARGGIGPDTVGAHGDGDTRDGVHDLAGNVAEWVDDDASPGVGIVHGGSWRSTLATEMRTWARVEVKVDATEAWIGARCAYDR